MCTSVSLHSKRPISSSSGIGANRPDTGADARSGSAERRPDRRRSPRSTRRRGRDRSPARAGRSRRARPRRGGAPTRHAPRGRAPIQSVHGVGADHAASPPDASRPAPRIRRRCVCTAPRLPTSAAETIPTESGSVRCRGHVAAVESSAGARGRARHRPVPRCDRPVREAAPPGSAVRALVRPRDRGRARALRAVAVRRHAVAAPGHRRGRTRALDLPLREAAASAGRAVGAAPRAEVVAAHAGAERLLRDGALPGDDPVPHLDVRAAPRQLPAGAQHDGDRDGRGARDPAHPGRAAAPDARPRVRRHPGPLPPIGVRGRRLTRAGSALGDALGARGLVGARRARGVLFSTSRRRWWIVAHPIITITAVVATGNHWWFDGIVAVQLIGVAIVVERSLHALVGKVRSGARAGRPTSSICGRHQPATRAATRSTSATASTCPSASHLPKPDGPPSDSRVFPPDFRHIVTRLSHWRHASGTEPSYVPHRFGAACRVLTEGGTPCRKARSSSR